MTGDKVDTSPGGWPSAPGDTLRAGDPPTNTAVEVSPARPENAMPTTALFLARTRLERALMASQRRTAGRIPTRAEKRLQAHYERQIRALDPEGNPS